MPIAKSDQVIVPVTTVLRVTPNSLVKIRTAGPIPESIHVERKVNAIMVEKARAFFHFGQLRGSLISSEG